MVFGDSVRSVVYRFNVFGVRLGKVEDFFDIPEM
jgi:hypothetical protein